MKGKEKFVFYFISFVVELRAIRLKQMIILHKDFDERYSFDLVRAIHFDEDIALI